MDLSRISQVLNKEFYNCRELAEMGVFPSETAARAATYEGKLKYHVFGKKQRSIPRQAVIEYVEKMYQEMQKPSDKSIKLDLVGDDYKKLEQIVQEVSNKGVKLTVNDFIKHLIKYITN